MLCSVCITLYLSFMRTAPRYALILILSGMVFALVTLSPSCEPIAPERPTPGSHGFRLWSGATLVSFEHTGGRTCTPAGWQPIGAESVGSDWAVFRDGSTGVFIQRDAFASTTLAFEHSSYEVSLTYPIETPPELLSTYTAMVRNAFEGIGPVFGDDSRYPTRAHTVLITAGIPFSEEESASIYPDPGPEVSYLILKPSQRRSEELFLHAIAHLYNRFQPNYVLEYQAHQSPATSEEWQEFEATWAETAFRTSEEGRVARLTHLLERQSSAEKDDAYLHYVLSPLVMAGIEGMLKKHETGTDVATLLRAVHADNRNFFDSLPLPLPEKALIQSWLTLGEPVDRNLVLFALED